jgi:hypothetical protein
MRRIAKGIFLGLILLLVVAVPVLAYYYAYLTVTESNGNSYTELPIIVSINTTALINGHYINANGTDTRVATASGWVLPHLLTNDKLLFCANITPSTTTNFQFVTGQSSENFTFPIIVGYYGNVTVPDNDDLEPGDVYAFGITGYIDTSAGTNKDIIKKGTALVFNVTGNKQLTFWVSGTTPLVANNILSGYHQIMIYSDGLMLWMEVDGTPTGTEPAAVAVNDTDDDWVLFTNNVMPYVYYYGEWVVK